MKKGILLVPTLLIGLTLPVNGVYAEEPIAETPTEQTEAVIEDTTPIPATTESSTETNTGTIEEAPKTEEKPVEVTPLPEAKPMQVTAINDGKLYKGRTLVPLRAISEGLGLEVKWDQREKQVTVSDRIFEEVVMTQDSNKIQRFNYPVRTLDVPVKNFNGKIYVPIAAAILGNAEVHWNNKTKVATIILGGRQVIVGTGKTKVSVDDNNPIVVNKGGLSDARAKNIIGRANDMANLLSISQKQTHFRPYFTQSYIRDIIRQNKNSEYAKLFKNVKEYEVIHNKNNPNVMYIEQKVNNVGEDKQDHVERRIVLKKDGYTWIVSNIIFNVQNQYEINNMID
ncbi:copper amine oxidase N-terminal domain-containing protein [Lysinibacillus yapensis]|uniref:Copper amine oxidase N-terminal domain-containing protein n=1 Tax=Ureibacillus yapensis TaxID=2304605 RepID=A0A396SDG0_9BACL|nr:copper amine oxidase N-terminal domain-containing protein [Lysinibacillus yapensis]RHW39335.1 copper amine oxidase N-terminal domain-containing protein [Lysinibacillus yapensis]